MNTASILRSEDTVRCPLTSAINASRCCRSTVTVLMCDIVSSTQLTTTLPLETIRNLLLEYYNICDDIVLMHNGMTLQYIGDGILSVFGEPFGRAGSVIDAMLAGLSICQHEFCHLDHPYKIRVTASTGEIATGARNGAVPNLQDAIFGTAPCLVARLQSVTPPGSFIIDQNTFEMIDTSFSTSWMGLKDLRGFQQLQPVWQVRTRTGVPKCQQSEKSMLDSCAQTLTHPVRPEEGLHCVQGESL